ncbi:hypothetical protein BCV69DRAFT_275034 [Microstroma glucosiphilum]|uniref:Uncharacterized protein n=1 Tax=Pseudomicrostroma glucosiphilum TaxID=1684307 RepID=A0A316UE62_9BASI|nr:hypothetical protein BCV69DRAFT_275034 [Pseudomicrostroma glucosiphilum]PWN23506.1 hypothetical protein BCV69DRAFT_275034 [Pseudomicrostroma glucosiphilum]
MADAAKEDETVVVAIAPSSAPLVLQYKMFEQLLGDIWGCAKGAGVLSLGVWPLRFFQKLNEEFNDFDELSFGIPSQSLQHLSVTSSDDLGLIEWWGDPTDTHSVLICCMDWLIDTELRLEYPAGGIWSTSACIEVKDLRPESMLVQMPSAASQIPILKRPDSCWPRMIKDYDEKRVKVNTVLEVAWSTETVEDLERELALWNGSGRNAIVFKVWWKNREGDEAALKEELPPDTDDIEPWVRHASILFITQGAQDSCRKVWRVGQPAEDISLRDPERIREMRGPLAALPKEWFGVMPTPDEPATCFPILLETLLEALSGVKFRS